MFLLKDIQGDSYGIYDTEDDSLCYISEEQVRAILANELRIYGLKLDLLKNLIRTIGYALVVDKRNDLYLYDGYLLYNYEYVDTSESSVYFLIQDRCKDVKSVNAVKDCLRYINRNRYQSELYADFDYTVSSVDNNIAVLYDESEDEIYEFDFNSLLYWYVKEHKCCESFVMCSWDKVTITDNKGVIHEITSDKYFESIFPNPFKDAYRVLEYESTFKFERGYDYLYSCILSSDNLDDFFDEAPESGIWHSSGFPLYNLFSYLEIVDSLRNSPSFVDCCKIIGLDENFVVIEGLNGSQSKLPISRFAKLYTAFANINTDIDEAVQNHIKAFGTQLLVMGGTDGIKNESAYRLMIKRSSELLAYVGGTSFYGFNSDVWNFNKEFFIRSSYGFLSVFNNDTVFNDCFGDEFSKISYLRLIQDGNKGTVVYSIGTSTYPLYWHKGIHANDYDGEIRLDAVARLFDYGYNLGLTYFNDYILPLQVTRIRSNRWGINVLVDCLIDLRDVDNKYDGCFYIMRMPLAFLGSGISYANGCYEYRTLLNTLYFDENIRNSLAANIDSSEMNLQAADMKPQGKSLCTRATGYTEKLLRSVPY